MGLDYCQNFVSAQYLLSELMEFDHIFAYALTFTRPRLGLLPVNFRVFTRSRLRLLHLNFRDFLYNRVMVLGYCQNFVSAKYLQKESMDLQQSCGP